MKPNAIQVGFLAVIVAWGVQCATGEETALFSSGPPAAIDVGEGSHYYGVQSVFSTNWYPFKIGETTGAGDWFTLSRSGRVTAVTFWGLLQSWGGGPGELHVRIYAYDAQTGTLTEQLHAWNSNTYNWDAFAEGQEDPSGLGSEFVTRWRVVLSELPQLTGETCLAGGRPYVLVVAGDDWADEFHWAANAGGGLTGGVFDSFYWADTTDVSGSGLLWSMFDLGHGPAANNLAFEIAGEWSPFGDFDQDCDVDADDLAALVSCLDASGPGVPSVQSDCVAVFDADGDQDVDLSDFAVFQESYAR